MSAQTSLESQIRAIPVPPKGARSLLNGIAERRNFVCFWQRSAGVTTGKIFAGELSY
jgi:hypothetical protein